MRNWIKIVGIILLIALVIFAIYKLSTQKEKYFSTFTFERSHQVYNTTGVAYLDTIVQAGLQSLNIDTVIVIIKPLINADGILPEGLTTKAYIKGSGRQYIIYIDNFSRDEYITILSHELIHLKQYYKTHPSRNAKQILDTRDNQVYQTRKSFCELNNIKDTEYKKLLTMNTIKILNDI